VTAPSEAAARIPAPTAPRPSAARDRLLRTASQLFYADGVRGVGVERVVAEASVTRATFYRHFAGKEALVVAYIEATDAALRRRAGMPASGVPASGVPASGVSASGVPEPGTSEPGTSEPGTSEPGTPEPGTPERAAAWLTAVTDLIGEAVCTPDFRGCAFINAAAEYPDPASPVRRAVRVHRDWLLGTVTEALRGAGHPDPVAAGRRWMALRDGAMVGGYLGDPAEARDTLRAGVRDLLSESA
jgi:AcrR family transcriptional regulator